MWLTLHQRSFAMTARAGCHFHSISARDECRSEKEDS